MATDLESLAREIEELSTRPPGELLPEAVMTDEDWQDYYKEVERLREASRLAPGAGRIILKSVS